MAADCEAAAAVFTLLASVALWVWPADEVAWRYKDMTRWRNWRSWFRL